MYVDAVMLAELGENEEAVEKLNSAVKINERFSLAYSLLGDIYKSQQNYDRAIRVYKCALEIDSDNPEVMISLALTNLRTNRNEPAKELLTSVVQMQPYNNTAYQCLGYCYLQLDDADKAIESYSRAIEINDKDWQAHRGLGVAYIKKEKQRWDNR